MFLTLGKERERKENRPRRLSAIINSYRCLHYEFYTKPRYLILSYLIPYLDFVFFFQNQLKELLLTAGFPEECLIPQLYNFNGQDDHLDTVVAILTHGHYPNVCYHKEKRKVLTQEAKQALVHKSSVNCLREATKFPTPFFVFGEKIRTRAVSCKQMTMVTPLHLLLFGSRKVEFVDQLVRLDGWINLKMDPNLSSKILALRIAIESIIIRAAKDPESISGPGPVEKQVSFHLNFDFHL